MKKSFALLFLLFPFLAQAQTNIPDQRPHAGQAAYTNKQNLFLKNQIYIGKIGINTASPASDIDIETTFPTIKMDAGGSVGSSLQIIDDTFGRAQMLKTVATGVAELDFDPVPVDGSSGSQFRFFRVVNTTGPCAFFVYKGDGTATVNSQFSGNGVSYVNAAAVSGVLQNFGVGTATPNALLSVGAGSNSSFQVNTSGLITRYNAVNTVSNGVAETVAIVDLTAQTANKGNTVLYAVPAATLNRYRVSCFVVETTAASVSSTLPTANILYTDNDTGAGVTLPCTPSLGGAGLGQTGVLTANTIGTAASGSVVVNPKASNNIVYNTTGYLSTAAGMAFALHLTVEAL